MSIPDNNMTDDLLVKYLVGEANETESRQAEEWISASDANREYYAHFKLIWDKSQQIAANSKANEDAAWQRLQTRISQNHSESEKQAPAPAPVNTRWIQLAASVILISFIGYIIRGRMHNTQINRISGANVVAESLPDGSTVTLNSNSKISYPAHFQGDQRLVSLDGEGFFKVTHDKAKPFIIKAGDVTVSVVGTSFDVKSRMGKTEVTVETGIVKVLAYGKEVQLHPGEKVIADAKGTELLKQKANGSLYNYYMTKELVCDQTPLNELVGKLNEVYGAHIEIANSQLHDLPITTVFKQQSLPQVLNVIAKTFNIKVEHQGNRILLK